MIWEDSFIPPYWSIHQSRPRIIIIARDYHSKYWHIFSLIIKNFVFGRWWEDPANRERPSWSVGKHRPYSHSQYRGCLQWSQQLVVFEALESAWHWRTVEAGWWWGTNIEWGRPLPCVHWAQCYNVTTLITPTAWHFTGISLVNRGQNSLLLAVTLAKSRHEWVAARMRMERIKTDDEESLTSIRGSSHDGWRTKKYISRRCLCSIKDRRETESDIRK